MTEQRMNFNDFDEIVRVYKEVQSNYRERLKVSLKDLFKEYFLLYGDIVESFGWTQYTPYWCDGDPCTFSVYDISYITFHEGQMPEEYKDQINEEDNYFEVDSLSQYNWEKDLAKLEQLLSENADLVLFLFGDHVKVIATKDSVEVEDYDHE